MAATPKNFNHKNPALQAVQFDTSSVTAMEDVRDWVVESLSQNGSLPNGTTVNLRTSMGGGLSWTMDNGVFWHNVQPGQHVCKDSNGKLFVLTPELLTAFYDEVVV